jgi:hypothetical protein
MGEWLIWLIFGSLILIVFCIFSLSSQLERCVHLAVEIITGNQRKVLEKLDLLIADRSIQTPPGNVITFERRVSQRRHPSTPDHAASTNERRRSPGRRREDLIAQLQ